MEIPRGSLSGLTPEPPQVALRIASNSLSVNACMVSVRTFAQGGEFREQMQDLTLALSRQNEHSVAAARRPVLSFDGDAGLRSQRIEGMGAAGGFLDLAGSLLSEFEQYDIAGHKFGGAGFVQP